MHGGGEQAIAYGIEFFVESVGSVGLWNWGRGRRNSNRKAGRDAGCTARIKDTPDIQFAVGKSVGSDEVTFGSVRIVIVHALRGLDTVSQAVVIEIAESGNNNRAS